MSNTILTPDQIDAIGAKYRPSNGHKSMLDYTDAIVAATLAELVQRAGVEPVMFAFQWIDGSWNNASHTEHSSGMKSLYPPEAIAELQARIEALSAQLEAQGEAVAFVKFKDGEVNYGTDDNIVISNTPGDCMDESIEWLPVFTHPAPAAPVVEERYLLNGARFKLSFNNVGGVNAMRGYRKELEGRWVALVAADDDCHLHQTKTKGE